MSERDPLADLLGRLRTETWQREGHAEGLLAAVAKAPVRRRRARSLLAFAAGATLVLSTLAATGGWRAAMRWFGFEVVEVQRGADGSVTRIRLQDADAALDMEPMRPDHEFADPPVFSYPRHGGGEVQLRIIRPGDTHLCPTFRAIGSAELGHELTVEAVPSPYAAIAVHPDRLELLPAEGNDVRLLPRIGESGGVPRYGDGRVLVELVP